MSPYQSLRNRKKQTRLQFQPLSSSSPVKGDYSNAIQDRLANVRFEQLRSNNVPSVSNQPNERSLLTPLPTSPPQDNLPDDSSPLSSLGTSPAPPLRFTESDSQSVSDEQDQDVIPPSSKRRRLHNGHVDQPRQFHEHNSAHSLPESSTVQFSTPSRRSSRLSNNTARTSKRLSSAAASTEKTLLNNLGSAESTEDEADIIVTKPVARRLKEKRTWRESSFVASDDEANPSFLRNRGSSRIRRDRNQAGCNTFIVDNDDVEYVTSDEDYNITRESSGPGRSMHQKAHKRSGQRSKENFVCEQEELAEDLRELQDSDVEQHMTNSRTRGGPVTTQRDKTRKHFELLKRRRAGEKTQYVVDSSDDDERYKEANNEHDEIFIDEIGVSNGFEIDSDSTADAISIQPDSLLQWKDEDQDEDDFVVEDESYRGRLGRPNSAIPLQFTSFASAKPRELFAHIIEWMVKNKTSPAFSRNDDVYAISFSRVDDQVRAQAGSRLFSSAWDAPFKNTVLARPQLHVTLLSGMDEDSLRTCDACNRSNHPARYEFRFSGKPYFKDTLEPVEGPSDDDDDDDDRKDDSRDDSLSQDEHGRTIPVENTGFYLGRFCAANAEMGHKLTHWKYHLNQQVLSHLEEQGVLSAEAIVAREKLNKKKREREAENIVDTMQETGVIAELWQAFQDDLDDARIGMEGHERKGRRNKARVGSVRVIKDNDTIRTHGEEDIRRQLAVHNGSDAD